MTTTADDRKRNAAEALGAVRAFHKAQDNWNRLNGLNAPKALREPAWADLWTTKQAMYAALLDIGEPTAKLVGSIDVLMEGIKGQLVDRKLLSFNDQLIFTETLRIIESELRKVAGIKERSFAELIAEKVVQKKDVKATAADATEAGDDKSVLTIHVADLTATYLCNQCRFDQCREWEDLKKLAHRPGCAVKISPVRASRLRTLLEPKLPAVAKAIYCVRGDRYAIRTTDLSVKVIEPAQAVKN